MYDEVSEPQTDDEAVSRTDSGYVESSDVSARSAVCVMWTALLRCLEVLQIR